MEKLFSERNFDDATYQLCADILGNYVSENELKTLFQTYDTSNKFMGLLGDGKSIVDSVVDVINYSSILQAYNETSDEFKEVLTLVDYYFQEENSELDYAITQYLLVADKSDINNQIIKKVVGNSIDVGKDLFEETILIKVRNFMIENIALTGIPKKIAAGKKIKLTAKVFPANASNKSVTWKSSNTKVATVNNAGVVKIKKGSGGKKVTITAMAMDGSGVKSTYRITSMKNFGKISQPDFS